MLGNIVAGLKHNHELSWAQRVEPCETLQNRACGFSVLLLKTS